MKKRKFTPGLLLLCCFLFTCLRSFCQFAPPAEDPESTAIHYKSAAIERWADSVEIIRGYINIAKPELGYASFGSPQNALGKAGSTTNVVSLGDGGMATYTLTPPIKNILGFDFAVFENAFDDTFLELAFVEVSSDGKRFVRFPSISLTQTEEQIGAFNSPLDTRKIHNLAGKYRNLYGTPFDLEELADSSAIDINHITHVRIIDVIGSIDPEFCSYDSQGNKINDPYPTEFNSSGFDLNALAILRHLSSFEKINPDVFKIFPNPTSDFININAKKASSFRLYTYSGVLIKTGSILEGENSLSLKEFGSSIYILQLNSANGERATFRILKY